MNTATGQLAAVEALRQAAEQISSLAPCNYGMRPDGREDPLASAWVEGLRDAHQVVVTLAEQAAGVAGRPVVMLDMDEVLADWTSGVMRFAGELHAKRRATCKVPTADGLGTFRMRDAFDDEQWQLVSEAMRHQHLYDDLEPMPGAQEAVAGLRAAGVDVGVCSSPDLDNLRCASAKLLWLEHHFDRDLAASAILTKDKTAVLCELLVDDKPNITGRHTPVWKQVLFDRRYNRHLDLPRLTSWDDWPLILDLLDSESPGRGRAPATITGGSCRTPQPSRKEDVA